MRVLFVAHSYPRWAGDLAGAFLHRLAVALGDSGVRVRVVAPADRDAPEHEHLDGVEVRRYRYAARGAERLAYTGTMAEQVRATWSGRAAIFGLLGATARVIHGAAHTVDLVHAHWWFPGGLAAAPAVVRRRRPLVLTLHGSDVRLARSVGLARGLFRRVAGRAGAVTAVSRWLCGEAADMSPGLDCAVAPMPVDSALFSPPPAGAPRVGVLFVGRLTAQKGVEALLRAAALVPALPVTIVGSGPDETRLRSVAEALGVRQRVEWVPAQPQERLADFYRRAAVVAVPSHQEGLGLVAVEAGLCGTPVVGFASGGLADVVGSGTTGVLVPHRDVEALARAIDSLAADPGRAAQFGERARVRAADFTPAATAARYVAVYRDVLAANAKGAGT